MTEAPTRLQRWLDVIAFLANRHHPVSTEALWRGVPAYRPGLEGDQTRHESVRRMFERDKKELNALGIPVETVRFKVNHFEEIDGYRLRAENFHLPYLELLREAETEAGAFDEPAPGSVDGRARGASERRRGTAVFQLRESEAAAALEGLKELASLPAFPLAGAARSAFRKLAFDLEPDASRESPVVYARDPEAEASGELVQRLSPAVRNRKAVTFRYRSMVSDTDEERRAYPYGLLFQHGRWYLVGHDVERNGIRMFRVGRMSDVVANAKKPGTEDFEVPEDFSLSQYAGRRAWELGADEQGPVDATVRFRFPRSLWAERTRHGELMEETSDGAQLRRFRVHRRDPFLRWVLSLAGDAWVESPDDLRDAFLTLARRVAEVHGETTHD